MRSNEIKTQRIKWIDFMEVIAIYFVIFYHGMIYSIDILAPNTTTTSYFLYYLQTILSTCVPLFFFINGYLLFSKPFDLKKHVFKTIKLVVLAEIWGAITLLILTLINKNSVSINEFLHGLTTWKQGYINHLWFIGALVCIYIIFPLLKVTYDNHKKSFIYFVFVCGLMTFGNIFLNHLQTVINVFLLNKNVTQYGVNYFNIFNPFRGIYGYTFVYFCLGGIVHIYYNHIANIPQTKKNIISILGIIINCLCIFSLGIIYSKVSGTMWDVVWNGYGSIFTLFNVIFLLSLNYQSDYSIISLISVNTLGIYFLHLFVIKITRPFLLECRITTNIFVNLVYTSFVLIVSLIVVLLIRKVPIINKLVK